MRVIHRWAAAGLALLLAAPSTAAQEFKLGAEATTLANGLTLVVIATPRTPAVAHFVYYKAGSIDEPQGKSGIAHFLEHMMFKGTPSVPDAAFSRVIARNGGRDNAFTTYDYTGYYQLVPVDKLAMVMEMEADRMVNLTFTETQLESERRVVLEERSTRTDNSPAALLREQTRAAFFLNHPYRIPVIGWEHEIRGLGHADARAYYERWYTPANAIVVIAGATTMAEVKAIAERTYARIPARRTADRISLSEPPRSAATRLEMTSNLVRQPYVSRAYIAPSLLTGESKHAYPLEILSTVMGSGAMSRLHRALVVERELAVSVGASYDAMQRGPAAFNVFATPRDGVPVAAVEAVFDAEIARILAEGVTAAEVGRAARRLQDSTVYSIDSLTGPARIVGGALAVGLTLAEIEAWPARIGAVTVDEVNAAARFVLRPEGGATSVLLPRPAKGT